MVKIQTTSIDHDPDSIKSPFGGKFDWMKYVSMAFHQDDLMKLIAACREWGNGMILSP